MPENLRQWVKDFVIVVETITALFALMGFVFLILFIFDAF